MCAWPIPTCEPPLSSSGWVAGGTVAGVEWSWMTWWRRLGVWLRRSGAAMGLTFGDTPGEPTACVAGLE
jgi:hypothetical protein